MITYDEAALEYISKLSLGGMRDAITMLDKCLSYTTELTLENVVNALGTVDYAVFQELTMALLSKNSVDVIKIISDIYTSGKDLKQFIKAYTDYVLDLCKYGVTQSYEFIQIPEIYELKYSQDEYAYFTHLLDRLVSLCEKLRWESTPKPAIETALLLECFREEV